MSSQEFGTGVFLTEENSVWGTGGNEDWPASLSGGVVGDADPPLDHQVPADSQKLYLGAAQVLDSDELEAEERREARAKNRQWWLSALDLGPTIVTPLPRVPDPERLEKLEHRLTGDLIQGQGRGLIREEVQSPGDFHSPPAQPHPPQPNLTPGKVGPSTSEWGSQ